MSQQTNKGQATRRITRTQTHTHTHTGRFNTHIYIIKRQRGRCVLMAKTEEAEGRGVARANLRYARFTAAADAS